MQIPNDFQYRNILNESLRSLIKKILYQVSQRGLINEEHYYITFNTKYYGIKIPEIQKINYPHTMTIVLQNLFWNLEIHDTYFSVSMNFNSIENNIIIPFNAIIEFVDPSSNFILTLKNNLREIKEITKKDKKNIINIDFNHQN